MCRTKTHNIHGKLKAYTGLVMVSPACSREGEGEREGEGRMKEEKKGWPCVCVCVCVCCVCVCVCVVCVCVCVCTLTYDVSLTQQHKCPHSLNKIQNSYSHPPHPLTN